MDCLKNRDQCAKGRLRWSLVAAGWGVVALGALHCTAPAVAQLAPGIVAPGNPGNAESEGKDASRLNINSEHERLLKRADELVRDGRFDLASTIWQRLLDEGGSALLTREQWEIETADKAKYRRYRPVAEELQQTIARLPKQGLVIYRAQADPEARAILTAADGKGREAALREVVRRYFLSSWGDDAALELASRLLDRHDFVGATRYLNQIDVLYPDPSVGQGEVLLRLAVASAHVGDAAGAESALVRLEALRSGKPPARLVEAVRANVSRPVLALAAAKCDGWPMRLGTPAGDGHMAPLPASYTATGLADGWYDELIDLSTLGDALLPSGARRNSPSLSPESNREAMIDRWIKSDRMPVGQVLVKDGHVFYKANNRVVCRDLATGKLKWLGWENAYQPVVPSAYQMSGWVNMHRLHRTPAGAAGALLSAAEIQLLGDRVHGGLSLAGNVLLAIESAPAETTAEMLQRRRFPQQGMPVLVRQRENRLTAYEASTGKLKWVRPAGEKEAAGEPAAKAGFLAAPVPFAKQLLVPIVENGTVWLASLELETGRTTWRTMICEEPEGGCSTWAQAGVAVSGGDVYVATGAGVVAALDALSGSVHWMATYPRNTMVFNPYQPAVQRPRNPTELVRCWQDDVVIASGSQLLVMPSDADEILALDRRNGELRWKTARAPTNEPAAADYCLGVLGECLYVAGPKVVRCYKISGGALKWEYPLTASNGRGLLTEDAIYVADGFDVVRLDPRIGPEVQRRELARARVVTPTGETLGNLFSDGTQIIVHGLLRTYVLEGLESRLTRLAGRIAAGDVEAQEERMRLYYRAGRIEDAITDLKGIWDQSDTAEDAWSRMLDGVGELNLPATRPEQAIQLLAAARRERLKHATGSPPAERVRQQSGLLGGAISMLKDSASVDNVLLAAELASEEYLVGQLCRRMRQAAKEEQLAELKKGAAHGEPSVRRVALSGLGKIYGDEARQVLMESMKDAEPLVRLTAAYELADHGERTSLPPLTELLASEEALIRSRAFAALKALTGETHSYQPHGTAEDRKRAIAAWQAWIAGPGASAKLEFPLRHVSLSMGRLLVASMATNQVVELDAGGKEVWKQQMTGPFGVHGTPDGHRLMANYSGRSLHEFDEHGKEVWKYENLPGNPSAVQRLPNGNSLAVLSNRGQVLEIAPDKKIVNRQDFGPGVSFVRRLDNGNNLVCMPRQGQVLETDPQGRRVAVFPVANGTAARRLDNGNTLIAEQGRNRVVEFSPAGQEVWSVAEVPGPWDVERLDNGNTIISNSRGVEEFSQDGRVVRTWNYPSTYRISVY